MNPSARWVGAAMRVAGRGMAYCAVLVPVGFAAVVMAMAGSGRTAGSWWLALRTRVLALPAEPVRRRPHGLAVAGHGLLSVLVGCAALVPWGVVVLFVLRGVLYGIVDSGPYDTSWGGPTLAGAWAAHFLAGLPFAVLGLAALTGIAAMHQRLTLALYGVRRARWTAASALLISAAGVLLLVAWTGQLPG